MAAVRSRRLAHRPRSLRSLRRRIPVRISEPQARLLLFRPHQSRHGDPRPAVRPLAGARPAHRGRRLHRQSALRPTQARRPPFSRLRPHRPADRHVFPHVDQGSARSRRRGRARPRPCIAQRPRGGVRSSRPIDRAAADGRGNRRGNPDGKRADGPLLAGATQVLYVEMDGLLRATLLAPALLLPGSFNPLHEGHLRLARVASEVVGARRRST